MTADGFPGEETKQSTELRASPATKLGLEYYEKNVSFAANNKSKLMHQLFSIKEKPLYSCVGLLEMKTGAYS